MGTQDSVLLSVKQILGIPGEVTDFNAELIMHINSVLVILGQLGVEVQNGCFVDEDTTWEECFSEGTDINLLRTYIGMKVRLIFDPPLNSSLLQSMQTLVKEYESRINYEVDPNE